MADNVPHPGMPQSDKDRLGLALMRAQERGSWAPDSALDDLSRDDLLAEAGKRRVTLTAEQARSKDKLLKAVRAVDPDAKGKTGAEAEAVGAAAGDQPATSEGRED
jgi:hypothetical protein